MADATKNCEWFYFRSLFAGAKTPLQCFHWLKKHTLNRYICPVKDTLQRPCQLVAIVRAWRSVPSFQHFAFTF